MDHLQLPTDEPTTSMTTPRKPWPKPLKRLRLGDAVAVVAQPIAKVIDKLIGTDIQHCESCADRKKRLNGD